MARGLCTLLAAAALSACVNPPGNYWMAQYHAAPSEAQQDLYFQPGSPSLASGEASRLRQTLASLELRPNDDILINLAPTGSEVIDQRRVDVARRAASGTPARVRIIQRPGFSLAGPNPGAALVQVRRYAYVRVACPQNGFDFADDLRNRQEMEIGCNNAQNRAAMAASIPRFWRLTANPSACSSTTRPPGRSERKSPRSAAGTRPISAGAGSRPHCGCSGSPRCHGSW